MLQPKTEGMHVYSFACLNPLSRIIFEYNMRNFKA